MIEAQYWAVIPAAGVGKRMGADRPKQYLELLGRTVIEHTVARFATYPAISGIVVALGNDDGYWGEIEWALEKPLYRAEGGAERCHSVLNALDLLVGFAAPDDWVLVHDAARPCLRAGDIDHLLAALRDDPVGGILATPVRDTMKRADSAGRIHCTEDREGLWHALTPQMFRLGVLRAALEQALADHAVITDEASALEHVGQAPKLVEGRGDNIKITRPEDLALAEFFLRQEAAQAN